MSRDYWDRLLPEQEHNLLEVSLTLTLISSSKEGCVRGWGARVYAVRKRGDLCRDSN